MSRFLVSLYRHFNKMKFCFCLILLSLFCLISAESRYETRTLQITNSENVEDFVYKGKESKSKGTRLQISSGQQAGNAQFPYVAELAINTATGGLLCTASLIGPNWLLTARHCAADKAVQSVLASFGSADRQSTRVQIYVDSLIWMNAADGNHPDIALFHLSQSAPTTSNIKPIRLPPILKEDFGYEGYEFTAIGWGQVSPGVFSRYLQYTFFDIRPKTVCNLGQYLICSQPPSGTSQLLGGDSGGPGVIVEADGIETLIGVNVAYVTSGTTVWQASTRVSSFLRWIQGHTGIVNDPDSLIPSQGGAACLTPGKMLKSKNGCYNLIFQEDGNVVIYHKCGVPQASTSIWSTKTAGKIATVFCMQGDGNLVLYNVNTPVWNSKTQNPGAYVILQDDGNFVIYKAGTSPSPQNALWWSYNNNNDNNNPDSLIPSQGGAACLIPGQMLKSKNGCYNLVFQEDGNVVIYHKCGVPQASTSIWSTKTTGKISTIFCMQGDGNLVLYNVNTPVWNSKTQNPGAYVILQDDGNFVIYKAETALWWSYNNNN